MQFVKNLFGGPSAKTLEAQSELAIDMFQETINALEAINSSADERESEIHDQMVALQKEMDHYAQVQKRNMKIITRINNLLGADEEEDEKIS